MIRTIALSALLVVAPIGAAAHQLVVFASVDCDAVTVEAKFSSGKPAKQGDVRILDGANTLMTTLQLEADGTVMVPLDSIDPSNGLVIEVDVGSHDNYWILTPDDIARSCSS